MKFCMNGTFSTDTQAVQDTVKYLQMSRIHQQSGFVKVYASVINEDELL